MKLLLFLAITFGLTGAIPADQSAHAARNFTGHYELANSDSKAFSLDVKQTGRKADVSFSAAHEDGSGAAPDADGKGRLNDKGDLAFTFTDSFENTGSAVLRSAGKLFQLSMTMSKVTEPRAVVHYGNLSLRRTSSKPQTNNR